MAHQYSTPDGLSKACRVLSKPKRAHTLLSGRIDAEWDAHMICNASLQPPGHVLRNNLAVGNDFKHGQASFLAQDTVDSLLANVLEYFAILERKITSPSSNQILYERCQHDLTALVSIGTGSHAYSDALDDDVVFQVTYAFNQQMHACMYYYLPLVTVDCRFNWTIVRTPRWIYHVLYELLSLQPVWHGDHMFTYQTAIGLPFCVQSDEVLAGALSLWDTSNATLEDGAWVEPLYRQFGATMVASNLLLHQICKTSL